MLITDLPPEIVAEISIESYMREKGRRITPYSVFKWWGKRFYLLSRALLASLVLDNIDDLRRCIENPAICREHAGEKVIVDPFMGGGTIVFEALKLGYKAVGIDIDRASELIVKYTLLLTDREYCKQIYGEIRKSLEKTSSELEWLWNIPGTGMIIHSFLARCPPCKAPVWITTRRKNNKPYDVLVLKEDGKLEWRSYQDVKDWLSPTSPSINLPEHILPRAHRLYRIYAVEILHPDGNRSFHSLLDKDDHVSIHIREYLKKQEDEIHRIYGSLKTKYDKTIPVLRETRRLHRYDIASYAELFTWRQYISIIRFIENTNDKYREFAELLAGDLARTCSLLAMYYQPYSKVNPGLVIKSYWLPMNPVELNPLSYIVRKHRIYTVGRGTIASKLRLINRVCSSGEDKCLSQNDRAWIIRADSTEYIYKGPVFAVVTDPPYPGYQSYQDMSLLYNYFINLGSSKTNKIYYDYTTPDQYMIFYKRFAEALSKWKNAPRYYVLIINVAHKKYRDIIPSIIASTEEITGLTLQNMYWFIGESPGKLGRSSIRGVFVLVFENIPYRRHSIEEQISNIFNDFNSVKQAFKSRGIDEKIRWEKEHMLIDAIACSLRDIL